MALVTATPMTGGTSKRIDVAATAPYGNVVSQSVYLYYKVTGTSGDKSIVSLGAYLESRVKIYCASSNYIPPETVQTPLKKDSSLRLNSTSTGDVYIFRYTENTDVSGYLLEYNVEPGMGVNGASGPGFSGGFDPYPASGTYFPYCCYATYRYWLKNVSGTWPEVALSSTETTKFLADWNYIPNTYGATSIRDSADVYLSFNNLPHIEYYPTEITDDPSGFRIQYTVPDPSKLDFIQFGVLDNAGNLLAGYKLASNSGTSYDFSFTANELETIWMQYYNVNNANVQLGVRSRNLDGDTVLVTYPMFLEIVITPPSLGFSVTDTDTKAIAATGDSSVIVRYQSDIKVTVNPQAYKMAHVVDYYVAQGNNKISNATTALFNNVQSNVFTVYAKDSRGNVTLQNITLSMVDYFPLTCNLAADTPTTEDKMTINLTGKYWSGNFGAQNNTISFEYKYTSNVTGNSIDWTRAPSSSVSINQGNYTTSFVVNVPNHVDTFTVQVRATDRFNVVTSNSVTVKSMPVFDWGQNDFNFNVPVSIQDDLTVNGNIYQHGSPIADFIIQTGTIGIWTYRLWDSGIAECWGTIAPAAHSITNAWGALYTKDNAIPQQNYPFQFTADPVVSMTLHNPTGNCWAFTGTPGGVSKSPAFGLARGASGSVTVGARIMAIGRWK